MLEKDSNGDAVVKNGVAHHAPIVRPMRADAIDLVKGRELELLTHLGVGWPSGGASHIRCPFPDHGDENPSWRWDDNSSRWFCSCEPMGGSIVDAVMRMESVSFADACAFIRAWGGESPLSPCKGKVGKASRQDPGAAPEGKAAQNAGMAKRIWKDAQPISGTIAAKYLEEGRGIDLDAWPDSLRFYEEARRPNHEGHFPALICALSAAPGGAVEAIGRVYLSEDGYGKADGDPDKAFLGSPGGGLACWLGTPGPRLVIVEGIEDALSVLRAGEPFVCAAFTGANMGSVILPEGVSEVILFGDRPKDGEGLDKTGKAALKAGRPIWEASGAKVRAVVAKAPHKDANEVLKAEGINAVRALLDEAERLAEGPQVKPASPADATAEIKALAAMDEAAFAIELKEHAKRLGLPAKELDRLVKAERRKRKAERRAESDAGEEGGRATQADILVRLAGEACVFFRSPDDTAYAAIEVDGHRETWPIRSKGFKQWLTFRYFNETGRAPNSDAMNQAQATVSAMAQFEGFDANVSIRVAEQDGKIYIDLADKDWRAIEITANGWSVIERPPVHFMRPRGVMALPEPERGGSIDDLRPFLNLKEEDDFIMVVAWLLAALRPSGPYPLIALAGAPGAAKSTSASILRGLVDPNVSNLRGMPKDERDVFIAASNSRVLALDNASSIAAWLSDALCRVATGGGYSTRELCTDGDEKLFNVVRPVIITGVGDVIARADLADRALTVTLTVVSDDIRKAEGDFLPAFDRARPRILGALCDAMAHGLRELPNVKLARLPRMADFIKWTRACEGCFWAPGTIQEVFDRNLIGAAEAVIESDAVALAVLAYLKANPNAWEGTVSEAYANIQPFAPEGSLRDKSFPRAPAALTNRLRMVQGPLSKRGVYLDWRRVEHGRVRLTAIWTKGQERPKWKAPKG